MGTFSVLQFFLQDLIPYLIEIYIRSRIRVRETKYYSTEHPCFHLENQLNEKKNVG